ncbi:MAG: phosphoenolpyruvate carboxykinase (ATP) [Clostridia bacterium]|jgi:phosphoenolpyruvate carboxykinase (ATP)|nr:phosphoenolpyruvate carboxykinase (ATP) [Clostridia bacterium]
MVNREQLHEAGYINLGEIYANLAPAKLVAEAIKRGEGVLSSTGALAVTTGKYTGRSPNDRYIVDVPGAHENVDWGKTNVPMSDAAYQALKSRQKAYLEGRDVFVFEGFIGTDKKHRLPIRVINEYAWQNLFVHQLLVRPTAEELADFKPEVTLVCTPGFQAIPELDDTRSEAFIILNMAEKQILIGAAAYAGEMKKVCFTLMNYLLPDSHVCPMHCSANIGKDGSTALFFGLSGTGKTTLSADPERKLIGDDEHGWSEEGIFNFEGGCYAKTIKLSKEGEPQIWDAIRFGTVIENVVLDENGVADYDNAGITENTRAGYPIHHIPGAVLSGAGGHPKTIIFLTADAFGVLPPISRLDINSASYHYLSGYTSKLAGTERGITEPQATFSAGFGAPFLTRSAGVYAELLREKLQKYGSEVYLLNTGWTGGSYGTGSRMKLSYTRAMVTAALNGELKNVKYEKDPLFNLDVPTECPNVPAEILNPKNTWQDKEAYDKTAKNLAKLFNENMAKLHGVAKEIVAAGPAK